MLLLDFGVNHAGSTLLFCDNQSALNITKNPVLHDKTKRMDVDCHFIRDKVQDGTLQISFVPSKYLLFIQLQD